MEQVIARPAEQFKLSIAIEGLRVSLRGKTVLEEVNLQVEPGRFCALLGPNGVGKTTLLRSVLGLIKPEEGRLFLLGREIKTYTRSQLARVVSYVPQGYHPLFAYSVLDLVVMGRNPGLSLFQVPGTKDRALALQALRDLGIEALAGCQVHQISGGELQLVLLARGLVQNTPLMLLDEPTASLDIHNQRVIMDMLRKLADQRGKTLLVTVHDPNLALEYADDIVLLQEGRVVAQVRKEDPDFCRQAERSLQKVYGSRLKIALVDEKPLAYWH